MNDQPEVIKNTDTLKPVALVAIEKARDGGDDKLRSQLADTAFAISRTYDTGQPEDKSKLVAETVKDLGERPDDPLIYGQAEDIIRKASDNHDYQTVSALLKAHEGLVWSRDTADATRKFMADLVEDVFPNRLGKISSTEGLSDLFKITSAENSPLDPRRKEQLEDFGALLAGFTLEQNAKQISVDPSMNSGYRLLKTAEVLDLIKKDVAPPSFSKPEFLVRDLPLVLAESAKTTGDQKQQRKLRLMALGVAIKNYDHRKSGTDSESKSILATAITQIIPNEKSVSEVAMEQRGKREKRDELSSDVLSIMVERLTAHDLFGHEIINADHLNKLRAREAAMANEKLKAEAKARTETTATATLLTDVAREADKQKQTETETAAQEAWLKEMAGKFSRTNAPDKKLFGLIKVGKDFQRQQRELEKAITQLEETKPAGYEAKIQYLNGLKPWLK